MDKVTVGIPTGFYYKYHNFWRYYFKKLQIDYMFSKITDKEIIDLGLKCSNDEMCSSLKKFLGHIAYLQDKCKYILIPRIDNYGTNNQMCTNFSAIYDLASNLFETPILNFNVDYSKKQNEKKGLIEVGKILGKSRRECAAAYEYADIMNNKDLKKKYIDECNKLKKDCKKILLMGHSYNIHDNVVGSPIINYLKKEGFEVVYSDAFSELKTLNLSKKICKYLYWKNNKESVGALELCRSKIDGIIMLSSFPCGPDSIVNELVIRRVKLPILNIIVDDMYSFTGIETRLESFVDIINNKVR